MYGALGKNASQHVVRRISANGICPKRFVKLSAKNAVIKGIQLKNKFQSIEKSTGELKKMRIR
jgi:hypothetical protein